MCFKKNRKIFLVGPLIRSQQLIEAKIPILRITFNAPFDDITVDLNANNPVGIKNTHLLYYYAHCNYNFHLNFKFHFNLIYIAHK